MPPTLTLAAVNYLTTTIREYALQEDRVEAWWAGLDPTRPMVREDLRPLYDATLYMIRRSQGAYAIVIQALATEAQPPAPTVRPEPGLMARVRRRLGRARR